MKHILALLFMWQVSQLFSQAPEGIKKGELSLSDYNITLSPADSSAEAILLYEKKNTIFTDYGKQAMESEYSIRIKILKTSGLDRGNISLPYWSNEYDKEKISDIEGFTYNLEYGKLETSVLTSASIFDEKVSEWRSLKKIILPNVKVGSVIEYHYRKKTPFVVDNSPDAWYFQTSIPMRWSEFVITVPASLSYRMTFGGYLPMHIQSSEKAKSAFDKEVATRYRFVMKDAPAFKTEKYLTTAEDYISKLEMGLISYYSYGFNTVKKFANSWGDIARLLNTHERFGDRLKGGSYLGKTVSSYANIGDSLEKLRALYNFVCKSHQWNEQSRLLAENDLKTVSEQRKGSSAELNLILLALLRRSGFEANPVILSTRNNGKIKEDFPLIDKFNYVIVSVRLNGKDILLDATEPLLMAGILPERCLSHTGYMIIGDTVKALSLKSGKNTTVVTLQAEIDPKGEVRGTYSSLSDGYGALSFRKFVKENTEKDLSDLLKKLHHDWEIENVVLENKEDPYKALKQNFDFSCNLAPNAQGNIYVNPLFSLATSNNPYTDKERRYPIDLMYPDEYTILVNLKIPEGYEIVQLPKAMAISIPGKEVKYSYVIEAEENMIRVKSRLLISGTLFEASQCGYLRELYNSLIQKQAEYIILRKK